jgi:hypothetical protein
MAEETFEEFLRETRKRARPDAWEAFCRVVAESLREGDQSHLSKLESPHPPIGYVETDAQISDRPKAGPIPDVKS